MHFRTQATMHFLSEVVYQTLVCIEGYDCPFYTADESTCGTSWASLEEGDDDSDAASRYHYDWDNKVEKMLSAMASPEEGDDASEAASCYHYNWDWDNIIEKLLSAVENEIFSAQLYHSNISAVEGLERERATKCAEERAPKPILAGGRANTSSKPKRQFDIVLQKGFIDDITNEIEELMQNMGNEACGDNIGIGSHGDELRDYDIETKYTDSTLSSTKTKKTAFRRSSFRIFSRRTPCQ